MPDATYLIIPRTLEDDGAMRGKAVLAYSGGLDTSVAIKWIEEKYGFDVVTLTLDVGQGVELEGLEQKARKIGAIKHYSIDAREEFVSDYVLPAVKANALYQGKYPLNAALSRPLIARKLVEVAHKEGAIAVAHGCTGKGNDQVRFEVTIKALDPGLKIVAPIREWNLSRDEEARYAEQRGIPIPSGKSPYSIDLNVWGRSIESGIIEDAESEPPQDAFLLTADPFNAPDSPEYITLEFEGGAPIGLSGRRIGPLDLLKQLNVIAGKHGVGRTDHIEDRLVGIKSREVYECPAALVIIEAHKDLEKAVLTRHELQFKEYIDGRWTNLVYDGLWLDPLREDLEAFIDKTQERVTGRIRVKLFKGGLQVVGRSSPFSLYDVTLSTYEGKTSFDQKWSEGFIELWGLPTKIARLKNRLRD